jgi:LysM repeat protein
MADRVKYFLLGVLFLVVAGVIAYDRWNSGGEPHETAQAPEEDTGGEFDLAVRPEPPKPGPVQPAQAGPTPGILPAPAADRPERRPSTLADLPLDPFPPTPEPAVRPTPRSEPKPEPKSPPKAEPKPATDRTHVIRKGETLEAIAVKYYGTRDGIPWIVSANGLANANRIYANQKLVIPAKKEIAKERGSGDAVPAKASGIPSRYKVKDGDGDLYAICRRLYGPEGQGARVSRIMELNHLWSADVKAGTLLILPPR